MNQIQSSQQMNKTIVIIDDDMAYSRLLQMALKKKGYSVFIISNLEDAENYLRHASSTDLFILDYDFSDNNQTGRDFCRLIKAYANKPVLMLTGIESTDTAISCLYAGADYFESKSCTHRELLAKIYAILRISSGLNSGQSQASLDGSTIERAGLKLCRSSRSLSYESKSVRLTERETSIAEYLLTHFNQKVARETVFAAIFGTEMEPLNRAVDILITRFRKKLRTLDEKFLVLPSSGGQYTMVCAVDSGIPVTSGVPVTG